MDRMGTQERIAWNPRNSHGKGNGNVSLTEIGMGMTQQEWEAMGIGQFLIKGKK
jgi:hypothetical protein